MNGIGAQEICVTCRRACAISSAPWTRSGLPEWNCWYHIMNCGFPLKASGETDFPCISGSRVGRGAVYVQLGKVDKLDFTAWCEGLAEGRSYVSDGYAHALEFTVDGKTAGQTLDLEKPGTVAVKAKVAFASEVPPGTAHGDAAKPRLTATRASCTARSRRTSAVQWRQASGRVGGQRSGRGIAGGAGRRPAA